jgi:chromosome partitioning protein
VARIIVFANRKGGCGKTTTAVNVAHGLALENSVLLIDMDAQAHASGMLGTKRAIHDHGIIQVLEQSIPVEKAIEETRIDNLALIRSSRDLGSFELTAGTDGNNAMVLAEQITSCFTRYEYVIIDPPPTLGILMVISLVAAQVLSSTLN